MLSEEQLLWKEFVNIGAWFSANPFTKYYVLYNVQTFQTDALFRLKNYNYASILDNIGRFLEQNYPKVKMIRYEHLDSCFGFYLENENILMLKPIRTYIEVE